MDEEYARKKELMDWIVAGMAGRHYPKPAPQDKTYVNLDHEQDDRPLLIKAAAKIPAPAFLKERLNVTPWNYQKELWNTDFFNGFEDAVKDKISKDDPRYERGVKLGKEFDKTLGILGFPASQVVDFMLEREKNKK